jgi:hypothetical protein
MDTDYIKQLEDANHTLQQMVDEIQVSNENLSSELKKYAVRLRSFSKTEWQIYIGYIVIGTVKFHDTNLYSIRFQASGSGTVSDRFTSLDLCRKFIIKYITEKPNWFLG